MESGYMDQQGSSGQGRSYTCSFCKRGFSNAQALGGHMNIHRKDRAKLRESHGEHEISLSLDIKNPDDKLLSLSESSEEQSCITPEIRPWNPSRRHDGNKDLVELPFFSDMASSRDNIGTKTISSSSAGGSQEKKKTSVHDSSQKEVLDLELRLGFDSYEKSSTSNTR